MVNKSAVELLTQHGLKITPQRIAILDVILKNKKHPTAETICNSLRSKHPNISASTVYKTLDTLTSKGIIKKVYSETETVRYDPVTEKHHHLYSIDTGRIEDYHDSNLNELIGNYFKKRKIPNFKIEDFKLQIIGKFTDKKQKIKN
jgi:Fur family peroxide stress response transcriptional regulator